MSQLWYTNQISEKDWNAALPIGNGRLGAMIFGGIRTTHLQLNEDSVWYGRPIDRNNPDARENLPKIRELLLDGKIPQAEELMKYALSGTPHSQSLYQPLGDVHLEFLNIGETDTCHSYQRRLSLEEAVCTVEYQVNGTFYKREVFSSFPQQVIAEHISADKKGKISCAFYLSRKRFYDTVEAVGKDTILLKGNLGKGGLDLAMAVRVQCTGGTMEQIGGHLIVRNADAVTFYAAGGTSFRYDDPGEALIRQLDQAQLYSYEQLKARHIRDYQSLYKRVELDLGMHGRYDRLPTDVRIKKAAEQNEVDPGLAELYFNFGRYLLISCSRPGTLPANLQGIWNDKMEPNWDSKYTININTEMNYWPAESCNLSECHMPLFDLLKRMLPKGRDTAQKMYGCRGFVAHHNTDIWGDTAVQDIYVPASYWVMGGAWLCTHIWMHYEYTGDKEFLAEYYPIMREAAVFFLDFLIEQDGYLVTCPSVSPENTFILPDGVKGSNTAGVTMDNQILRDLFEQCLKAIRALDIHEELEQQFRDTLSKLRPTQIGKYGQIMEWAEDYEEEEPGHRHISHLYGLHPSGQISMDRTPELAKAARVTLERRLANGGGHTGWSRAWIINHYAKLWDGDKAYENFEQLLIHSTLPNMLDNHPPFQIDGNFGATAAIAEMLVQSNEERIVLLPALPAQWKNGRVKGLCVRGGGEVEIYWKDHTLVRAVIKTGRPMHTTLVYEGYRQELYLKEGEEYTFYDERNLSVQVS